jgi:hypothetical protein
LLQSLIDQWLLIDMGCVWSEFHAESAIKLTSFVAMVLQNDLWSELTEYFSSFINRSRISIDGGF